MNHGAKAPAGKMLDAVLPGSHSHLLHPVNYYKGSDEGQRAPKSSVREKISSSLAAMIQPTPASSEPPALPGDTRVAFEVADIIVVVFYFAFVLAVGIWVSP